MTNFEERRVARREHRLRGAAGATADTTAEYYGAGRRSAERGLADVGRDKAREYERRDRDRDRGDRRRRSRSRGERRRSRSRSNSRRSKSSDRPDLAPASEGEN